MFGPREPIETPFGMTSDFHKGIDLASVELTPIVAFREGVIEVNGWLEGYGNTVAIAHDEGLSTLYAHLAEGYGYVGQKVHEGQLVGRMGSTGNSTDTHLHFEVRVDGEAQDPEGYLRVG